MEQAHLRVLVQALEEVLEWVDHEGEERVAQERVQAQQGSVFVPNAELSQLMRLEFLVTKRIVLNVGQRW
jgi:hypothetical protein